MPARVRAATGLRRRSSPALTRSRQIRAQERKMRTTRFRSPRPAAMAAPSDSFEEIRQAFCIRLQSEGTHFAALNAALACTPECPTPILDDLRNRAHRLSGTAAIFEFAGVAAAAR